MPKIARRLAYFLVSGLETVKTLKVWTPKNNYYSWPENGTVWFYHAVMGLKVVAGMANSVDSDQSAP